MFILAKEVSGPTRFVLRIDSISADTEMKIE